MEEHTRQIAARNRYLALNKKAIATKVFQSLQDARLRAARERQGMRMPEDQVTIPVVKMRQSEGFPQIRRLLGL
jgi:pantothenate synthetase